jgi:Putative transmembrane protein 170
VGGEQREEEEEEAMSSEEQVDVRQSTDAKESTDIFSGQLISFWEVRVLVWFPSPLPAPRFFAPHVDTPRLFPLYKKKNTHKVWLAISVWNSLSLGAIYLVTGVIMARMFRAGELFRWKFRAAVLIPVATTFVGMFAGFLQGTLFAVGVAFVYSAGGFVMEWTTAAIWGTGCVFCVCLCVCGPPKGNVSTAASGFRCS